MNGTSSSAPIISGVAALIYQVNPDLTWRDVRHIMATTATKIDVNVPKITLKRNDEVGLDPNSFIAQDTWQTNQAGYAFHPYYGFGMVDATKAVQMAANGYQNLPQLVTTEWIAPKFNDNQQTILENYKGASKNIEVTDNATIESIQIKISITHSRISDLAIVVFSPNGTRSVVMTPRSLLNIDTDINEEFDQTILLSHAFYGEQAKGTWKVQVVDTNQGVFKYYAYDKNDQYDACKKSYKYYNKKSKNIPNNKKLGTFQEVQLKIFGHP
ncbi:MAG: proprotein convertase P-domain-containing protein [Shewanellaceae bacterium]|nr:proprotein convertase P-domain-containing protein [Shewanellaceae bacterium]